MEKYLLKGDDWFKDYFRSVLNRSPDNLIIGDKMTFGMRFRDKDGNWSDVKIAAIIDKKDL